MTHRAESPVTRLLAETLHPLIMATSSAKSIFLSLHLLLSLTITESVTVIAHVHKPLVCKGPP